MTKKETSNFDSGSIDGHILGSIPLEKRQHWATPGIVYAGCEFALTVIMTGSGLVSDFSISRLLLVVVVGLIISWIFDSMSVYLSASTGRPASVIARSSFGIAQSRVVISLVLAFATIGWWAFQTAVVGNAVSAMVGIDYTTQRIAWAIITIICGAIFAIPSIIGFTSMAWVDYIAYPAGMLIIIWSLVLGIKNMGWSNILAYNPTQTISFTSAISTVIGAHACQMLMIADYGRFCKPEKKDAILMPMLTMMTGFILLMIGGIIGVGEGSFDIVKVLIGLGFPAQAFICMFLAQWTTQMLNNYTIGLALCNAFNLDSEKNRVIMTIVGAILGIVVTLLGILDYYQILLNFFAILFPPIVAIMIVDYFLLRDKEWYEIEGWNIIATIAYIAGGFIGYYTQYINVMGIPAIQSWAVSAVCYYGLMYFKSKMKPDQFSPKKWEEVGKN